MKIVPAAVIIAIGIVIASYFHGGRFAVSPTGSGSAAVVVDRISGNVRFCTPTECRRLDNTNRYLNR